MITEELKKILKQSYRYKDFVLFDKPVKFNKQFKDENIDIVQLHSAEIIECDENKHIIGFIGSFSWIDNKLTSLDGDTYSEDVMVLGYEDFGYKNAKGKYVRGLDILV